MPLDYHLESLCIQTIIFTWCAVRMVLTYLCLCEYTNNKDLDQIQPDAASDQDLWCVLVSHVLKHYSIYIIQVTKTNKASQEQR